MPTCRQENLIWDENHNNHEKRCGCQVGRRERKCLKPVRGVSPEYTRNAWKIKRNPKGKMDQVRRGKTKRKQKVKSVQEMLKLRFQMNAN